MCRFKYVKRTASEKIDKSFNTSYVSVQEFLEILKGIVPLFQYILCVGSRVVKDITIVGKD